ncbi:C-type lectin domain family 4 member G-like isoform X2 [Tachyglossus aculeatus]|uniref:C-type lectin domain family 4 member G-like isoform X2 n=1 Tax=Tachyglossus aculeatus TaxID=9261 RepID=UPI0018F28555|nr:C-type lectin domain family 4 member G-like isoform X2 [Tachyglossus aculeatus]
MERVGYSEWKDTDQLSLAEPKSSSKSWSAGSRLLLMGCWATLPRYLVMVVTLILWGSLLSIMLTKGSETSVELGLLQEEQNRLSTNGSEMLEQLETIKKKLETMGSQQQESKQKLEALSTQQLETIKRKLEVLGSQHLEIKSQASTRSEALRRLQDEQSRLSTRVTKELDQTGKALEDLRSEMFRVVGASQSGNASSCKPCPPGWRNFEGSCYFFSSTTLLWPQAKDNCIEHGAHLVIINNQHEQDFLTQNDGKGYWIGLTDMESEGTHKWIDGTDLTFTYWNTGEPNDSRGVEDCVMMLTHGRWNDFRCTSDSDNWICEKKQIC